MKAEYSSLLYNVTFCGIAIVFIVLILLVLIMYISGSLNTIISKPKKDNKTEKVEKAAENDIDLQEQKPTPTVTFEGVDDETVAVISAAVYSMYCDSDVTPKIQLIKPSGVPGRKSWAAAGIRQNTKAF